MVLGLTRVPNRASATSLRRTETPARYILIREIPSTSSGAGDNVRRSLSEGLSP